MYMRNAYRRVAKLRLLEEAIAKSKVVKSVVTIKDLKTKVEHLDQCLGEASAKRLAFMTEGDKAGVLLEGQTVRGVLGDLNKAVAELEDQRHLFATLSSELLVARIDHDRADFLTNKIDRARQDLLVVKEQRHLDDSYLANRWSKIDTGSKLEEENL